MISRYAAAMVRTVRSHPQELGCIREDALLAGDLDYQDFKRLPREDEAVVLRTLLETFILEKAVYELDYEGNNRPDWLMIPVHGIEQILE